MLLRAATHSVSQIGLLVPGKGGIRATGPPVLANAIEATARRWLDMAAVDVGFRATPGLLRVLSAEARRTLGRRRRAIEASGGRRGACRSGMPMGPSALGRRPTRV